MIFKNVWEPCEIMKKTKQD